MGRTRCESEYVNAQGRSIVNVYGSQDIHAKRDLWEQLRLYMATNTGMVILLGDFNVVRYPSDRLNSDFCASSVSHFNDFISEEGLHEYTMGGQKYTHMWGNGRSLNKIDRVLVCHKFMNIWPMVSFTAMPQEGRSDHTPLLLKIVGNDYGPIPFRFFNTWFDLPGLDDFVRRLCNSFMFSGPTDLKMAVKLKWLKRGIKTWIGVIRKQHNAEFDRLQG